VDRNNPIRVLRALERCWETGLEYGEILRRYAQRPGPFDPFPKFTVLLERDGPSLERDLHNRIQTMLKNGWIDEVEQLKLLGLERNPSASRSVGYAQILQYLDGKVAREELVERIFSHTKKLVRKQRTWFRRQIPIDEALSIPPLSMDSVTELLTDRVLCRHCGGSRPANGSGLL
jgi:tRNA dimethylallyltransferase